MLKKIQQDFSYYSHEFKDNYRKGVHRLRTILGTKICMDSGQNAVRSTSWK